jgi:hypothetical protein
MKALTYSTSSGILEDGISYGYDIMANYGGCVSLREVVELGNAS